MDIGNILVIICIWNSGVTLGETRVKGGELYRVITERARELLSSIKHSIVLAGDEDGVDEAGLGQTQKARTV
jgi:hypothetical protein